MQKFDQMSPQPLMPLLPLSSSDEGFTVEGIAAEEEEGRQSRLGIREGEHDESRLGAEPEEWTYRSEDCLTYEDCLDNCLESPAQIQLQEKEIRPDCRLVQSVSSERKEQDGTDFKDVKKQRSEVSQHEPSELPTSPVTKQTSEDIKSDKHHQQSVVQCSVVLVDKQIARRSPLNSAKPPGENFFLSSFRRAGENMAAANSLSAIGETVNKNKDSTKKRQDSQQNEAEQKSTQIAVSRGKKKEQDEKGRKEDVKIKREEEQKQMKEDEQKRLTARKSRDMNPSKAKEVIRKSGQEAPKGIKSRDPKTKSLTTDLLKGPEKSLQKLDISGKKSSDKSVKKSVSAPLVPLDPVVTKRKSSSSSSTTIASESLASRAKHSSQERLRKLKKTITTSREEVKPRPVTTPTSTPSKRVHRTSSCSSSSSTKSSKSGSLTISSSYSSKSGSLSLSSTPSPTSNAERLRNSKVAPNHSKRSAPKTPTQHLITMKDGDKKRQHSVSSPSSSTKKKTPLVLEDTGGKQAVQVSYSRSTSAFKYDFSSACSKPFSFICKLVHNSDRSELPAQPKPFEFALKPAKPLLLALQPNTEQQLLSQSEHYRLLILGQVAENSQ